jgi:hypothetical protein
VALEQTEYSRASQSIEITCRIVCTIPSLTREANLTDGLTYERPYDSTIEKWLSLQVVPATCPTPLSRPSGACLAYYLSLTCG